MKKIALTMLLTLSIASSTSQAAIVATGTVTGFWALWLGWGGVVYTAMGITQFQDPGEGLGMSLFGIILLDGEKSERIISFKEIGQELALKANISNEETEAFNEEIEEINLITQSVQNKFLSSELTPQNVESFQRELDQAYEQTLSPESIQAIVKIKSYYQSVLKAQK
ncbi:MAG: hypothetical protein AB7I27_14225 [Bacteriovoracaceae bacterium]